MKSAIKPNHFNILDIPAIKQADIEETMSQDTKALSDLSHTRGWEVLEGFIDSIVSDLDQMTINQMQQGVGFDEIGRSTVVKEITKDVLRRIKNRVRDSADSINRVSSKRGEAVE